MRKWCYGSRKYRGVVMMHLYFKSVDMCNYQTLFHDDNLGYVVHCNECEKIQLSRLELDEFIVMLETADNELQSLALLKLFSVE